MIITVRNCDVEVEPTDTIWTLKMKIYSASQRSTYKWQLLPPDDQRLVLLLLARNDLNDCGNTLERVL